MAQLKLQGFIISQVCGFGFGLRSFGLCVCTRTSLVNLTFACANFTKDT
jgi:hypothetical protein